MEESSTLAFTYLCQIAANESRDGDPKSTQANVHGKPSSPPKRAANESTNGDPEPTQAKVDGKPSFPPKPKMAANESTNGDPKPTQANVNGKRSSPSKPKPSLTEAQPDCSFDDIPVDEHNENCSPSIVPETSSDRDDTNTSGDTVVPLKKFRGVGPQAVHEQDEIFKIDWDEKIICIKCNKGGRVLVCNSSACPIVVHATCMGCSAQFDDTGNFYCPYCLYKKALTKIRDARVKTILSKKALSAFIEKEMVDGNQQKGKIRTVKRKERTPSTIAENLNCHDSGNGVESSDTICGDTVPILRRHMKQKDKDAVQPQKGDSPSRLCRELSPELVTNAMNNEKSNIRSKSRHLEDPSKLFTSSPWPNARRKKWSSEEEEMLKEGVGKFSTTANKNIPWRKILEFSRHVFDATRTPSDLKDKWRNILAKERPAS